MPFLLGLVGRGRGQAPHDLLQKVAQAQHVGAADGDGIAQAQVVIFVELIIHPLIVHLVDHQQKRLARAAQVVGHVLVLGGQARAPVAEKADHIGGVHGDFRLAAHLGEEHVLAAHVQAPGIHHAEAAAHPFHVGIDAVARHARHILHDGDAPSRDLVEKCRFAHVRAAYDGHQRLGHGVPSFNRRSGRAARRKTPARHSRSRAGAAGRACGNRRCACRPETDRPHGEASPSTGAARPRPPPCRA